MNDCLKQYTQNMRDKSALRPPCSELLLKRASVGLTFPPACSYTAAVFALVQEKWKQPQALSSCYYMDKVGHGTAMEVFICVLFV